MSTITQQRVLATSIPGPRSVEMQRRKTATVADGVGTAEITTEQRVGAKTKSIIVHDPNNSALRLGCADLKPSLQGLTYAWDFGDGATANGVTATHEYATAGTYPVRLTVTDDGGATATVQRSVTVSAPAPPDQPGEPGHGAVPVRQPGDVRRLGPPVELAGAGGDRRGPAGVDPVREVRAVA